MVNDSEWLMGICPAAMMVNADQAEDILTLNDQPDVNRAQRLSGHMHHCL